MSGFVYVVPALGTSVELLVDGPEPPGAVPLLHRELEVADRVASRFRPDSELARLNASAGRPWPASHRLFAWVEQALQAAAVTDGAVDPTVGRALVEAGYDRDFAQLDRSQDQEAPRPRAVPGWRSVVVDADSRTVWLPSGCALDLGATAKADLADRLAVGIGQLTDRGVLVSIGGDLRAAGPPPPGGWSVALTEVSGAVGRDAPTVAVTSGGMATSGTSARAWTRGGRAMHHIIDPATGLPVAARWRSVTVAAATCLGANIASTAAMIKNDTAPGWLRSLAVPARLVPVDGGPPVTVGGWPEDDHPRDHGAAA
ncbi:MAG TPA: FAD:protein FMN transferase [Acidimicrobiales bacterium]|nr:FAD:protein FMN transferase [Acidimicrobiales bacterium]